MKHLLTSAAAGCLLALPALAQPNCVSKYPVLDPNGQCVGDLVNLTPPLVIRQINGGTSDRYILDVNKFYGIPLIATFVYPTADCSGDAYMTVDPAVPISHAYADWNKVLWAPDPSNYEQRYQQSYQFGGPFCYHYTAIVDMMPALVINSTLVSRLVAPFH